MNKTLELHITFFGGLKDYFDSALHVKEEGIANISQLLLHLNSINHKAKDLLDACAVVVDGVVVKSNIGLKNNSKIVLLPPYSGG